MATGHAERLMPMIEEVMAEACLSFDALDRITLTRGPGTFTGTRISVAAARALGFATRAKFVAISSLELMARNPLLPSGPGAVFAIATDARRDEVYLQLFSRFTLRPIDPPAVVALEDVAGALKTPLNTPGPIEIAGSGAEKAAAAARRAGCDAIAICPNLLPDAIDILFASSEMAIEDSVSPLYLRPPDAKPPAQSSLIGAPA